MFSSLWRGLVRILVLALIGAVFVHASVPVGRLLGAAAAPIMFNIGLLFYAIAAGDAALRMLLPRLDAQQLAVQSPFSFIGHCLLRAAMFLLFAGAAHAAQPPAAAAAYLPVLKEQLQTYAPELQPRAVVGAQIHRETGPCPGRKCWKVNAQLRTSREQGISFGQLTRAWDKFGRLRFDKLTEIVQAHPDELAGLSWANPFDAVLQLRAVALMDRDEYEAVDGAATDEDRWAFALARINGGPGGLHSDRLMCEATDGCDPSRWFGNVENTSLKARQAVQGYGQSFFEINRSYVRTILRVYRALYTQLDS